MASGSQQHHGHPRDPLRLVSDVYGIDGLIDSLLIQEATNRELRHHLRETWDTSVSAPEGLDEYAIATSRSDICTSVLLDLREVLGEDCIVLVELSAESLDVGVAARTRDGVGRARQTLRAWFPPVDMEAQHKVPVSFWSYGDHASGPTIRAINVPSWPEVASNYPAALSARLAGLMEADSPDDHGRFMLWHGRPGTGKTYALRALAWSWRSWCRVHYVIDPDVFFRESGEYMLPVLLNEDDEDDRWRLIVLEDAGELLTPDAKERVGQDLSRLLNVLDGVVGQGLRLMFLVTTNEKLTRIHPALTRPGRAAAPVSFEPFPADEAARWLASRGVSTSAVRQLTIAELYAVAAGRSIEPDGGGFGFAPG